MINKQMRIFCVGILCLSLAAATHAGDLNQQAQTLFDDLGAIGNVTGPQAFKGQTLNTYTGGSLFVRMPTKNYQLVNMKMPYIRAGCGGIDIFAGSFSHISEQAFQDMLKNISSQLPGVIFDMMLKSVEPLLGSTMEWFKGIETMINRANINSCEAAKDLVSGAVGKLGFSSAKMCEGIAMTTGVAKDAEDARLKCADSSGVEQVLNKGESDSRTKEIVPFYGNLIWEQMKKFQHLDNDDKQLVMSIVGTTVYAKASDDAAVPQFYPPTIRSVTALLYGNTLEDLAGLSNGEIKIKMLKCGDLDKCADVREEAQTMQSLTHRVRELMLSIAGHIQERTELTEKEAGFISVVSLPVYKLLSAANAINNPAVSLAQVSQYAEYVAVDFAHALLSQFAFYALDSSQAASNFNAVQAGHLLEHRRNAELLLQALQGERRSAESRAQSFETLSQYIERLERNMRSNMPQQIADLMAYSGAPGGR